MKMILKLVNSILCSPESDINKFYYRALKHKHTSESGYKYDNFVGEIPTFLSSGDTVVLLTISF